MADITPAAARKFKDIFSQLEYDNAAIKLGNRPKEPDSSEHYIDFIPDDCINLLNDVIQLTNGVMIIVRREDEKLFEDVLIDYIEEPQGFVFGNQNG